MIERVEYIERCFAEHLLKPTYTELTHDQADKSLQCTRQQLISALETHYDSLSEAEKIFFERGTQKQHRLPQFYITMKIHKQPIASRPIVSCVNSLNGVFSRWLDHHMKKILHICSSHVKNWKVISNASTTIHSGNI